MYPSHLKIDTSLGPVAGPSRERQHALLSASALRVTSLGRRMRSVSNASSTSSMDIVSPNSSSTNASSSSLLLPGASSASARTPSPTSAVFADVAADPSQYVLAMHDYAPQTQNATCLSFRAGQVIHVLNRDPSGWWDGELEGRRGWFPSNYVNAEVNLTVEEEDTIPVRAHAHNKSTSSNSSSTSSWVNATTREFTQHTRHPSMNETLASDVDSYYPPIMIPLLHGLFLLQSAVRSLRISHFQPSTACIISCVRSILSATETLLRDAPILQQFPVLATERRRILAVLAQLVAQAKRASEDTLVEQNQEIEIDSMMRLGGQVFAHVRRFLAVAVQCGVELPERRQSLGSVGDSTETERHSWDSGAGEESFDTYGKGKSPTSSRTPKGPTTRAAPGTPGTPGYNLRAKSTGDLRSRPKSHMEPDTAVPALPSRSIGGVEVGQEGGTYTRERVLRRHKPVLSHISTPSSSSFSSLESIGTPARPAFPQGPCSSVQVMEALRYTHDHYLSTIAAFIGHAHSHSRFSHASSTGHMYDLVREIVEMVCKLLTIVDAVLQHPDVPNSKLGNLKAAKEGLYNVTSALAEAVRLLTLPLPPNTSDEAEKQALLRSATAALKAGADCVSAVKMCLTRSLGERPFILHVPSMEESSEPFTPSKLSRPHLGKSPSMSALSPQQRYPPPPDEDMTIQLRAPMIMSVKQNESTSGSESSGSLSKSSSTRSEDTNVTAPDEAKSLLPLVISDAVIEHDIPSPTSFARTDDGTTWEGSTRHGFPDKALEAKILNGTLPSVPLDPIPEAPDPIGWMLSHDYPVGDIAYNSDGHLVGATLDVLVEKMTPHDSIVDPAFSAVFFLTFRLFSSPVELIDAIIARYNLLPPEGVSFDVLALWQQRKGIPVRLRVSNFIKTWVETYWRPGVDDPALPTLTTFTREGLAAMFPGPAQRILDLLDMRRQSTDMMISPKGDRTRDPGMSLNPPSAIQSPSEIPRPSMTKTLLSALRAKNFASISIMDFDALELARQLTIMECNLYCAINPVEVLETGQEGAKPPVNVRAVSTLSTVITGWVAESILSEHDAKKRTLLVKFFIKVADRCTSLHNYSTPRSMLAALDSSTISRLHQTWLGVPQKNKLQLEGMRRLADHSRNYHEYRSKLRNTAPPAVPFLGLYLTDVTFCREGNPSHRASPTNPEQKLLNFNKYHKLARIVQDMQRFQVPYNLKAIPEVQEYLSDLFQNSRHHGDLQDLYRRSLLVEPKQPADAPPVGDMRQLFNWATRSQPQGTPAFPSF